jgi:hypothetical protein
MNQLKTGFADQKKITKEHYAMANNTYGWDEESVRKFYGKPPRTLLQFIIKERFLGKPVREMELNRALSEEVRRFNRSREIILAREKGPLTSIDASRMGRNAREKIMAALEEAAWYEVPIEIDEVITPEELLKWKSQWYSRAWFKDSWPGGGDVELARDLGRVTVILPDGTEIYDSLTKRRIEDIERTNS